MTIWRRAVGIYGALFMLLLLFSSASYARDVWELKDGDWYFYLEPEVLPEDYQRESFNGWIMESEDSWYYAEESRLQKGWVIVDGKFYYFLEDSCRMAHDCWIGSFYLGSDGAALMDTTAPDGTRLSSYGSRLRNGRAVEELNDKTARYIDVLKEHRDAWVELGSPGDVVYENGNGKSFLIFKTMKLYDRKSSALLYSGDGAFEPGAEITLPDGAKIRAADLLEHNSLIGNRVYINPAGLIVGISRWEGQ